MNVLLLWAWVFTLPGLLLSAFGAPAGQKRAGWASLPGPIVVFVVALIATLTDTPPASITVTNWVPFLPDTAFSLVSDPLSEVMLLVVGFVASLVYFYSQGYMSDDPGKRRFFVYLDLFVSTMSILVLAGNLVVLLIGWTGVGIASFLLISFWREKSGTLNAGLQALAANAIGDAALLLAAALVPAGCGALATLATPACTSGMGGAELIAALIFIAAAAKSAQGPLYFWLPSAMAGPTPISALIHAATMVAAGVYLLVRADNLLTIAPTVSLWVAGIGVATAVAASAVALIQANFKRGIAYSTVAQLGYMFAAVGIGEPFGGFFHLFTHASFKGLLFLAAGVVIHGEGGEELLSRLSGRGRRYVYSYWGFLIGALSLMGIPVFAGAFSKDLIIETAMGTQPVVGYLLLGTVLLTGLYIGRLFFRVYHGQIVTLPSASHAGHEDPVAARWMNWSLLPLMVTAIFAGWVGPVLEQFEATVIRGATDEPVRAISAWGLIGAALGLTGFAISWWWVRQHRPVPSATETTPVADGWVSALAGASYSVASTFSRAQSGLLATYAFGSIFALALVVFVTSVLVR
jgi:NADH-quinone oxidoreductase subunit L